LRDDQVRDIVIDRSAKKDDVVPQQAGINVVRPLAPAGLLDHHGYKHGLRLLRVPAHTSSSRSSRGGGMQAALCGPAVKMIQGLIVADAMPNSIQPSILRQTGANLLDWLLRLVR